MRKALLVLFGLTLLVWGCSGGGSSSGGSSSGSQPQSTGSLSLRLDLRDLSARQERGILTTLVIRVVDADNPELDVVSPTQVDLRVSGSQITQTIQGIPAGQRRVRLVALDDEGNQLGHLISDPVTIAPGTQPTLVLHVPLDGSPTPGPAVAQLRFLTQPTGTLANQVLNPPVVVELLDTQGNRVETATDAVSLSLNNGGSASLLGTTTVNASGGLATFSDLSVSQSGTGLTLLASAPGVSSVTSTSFDVAATVGPPAQLVFITQPVDTDAGVVITPAVQVVVQDANGITVPTATDPVVLALGSNPGAATLGGALSVVPNNGVATFPDLTLNVAGVGYTLTATSTGLPVASSSPFDVIQLGVNLVFGTQPANGQARQALTTFTVEIHDQLGQVVTTSSDIVTLNLASNPGPATLSGTVAVTAVNGVATFSNVVLSKSGTGYTLNAAAPGLTSTLSNPFDQSFPRGFLVGLAGFPLGGFNQPLRGDISPDGNFIYIGEFGVSQVQGFSINPATGALTSVGNVGTGGLVGDVNISPDGLLAISSNASANSYNRFTRNPGTGVLTPAGGSVTGTTPLGVVIRPGAQQFAYVMNFGSSDITVFDASTGTGPIGSPFSAGAGVVQNAVVHPNNNFLLVNNGAVFAINGGDGSLTPVAGSPFATANGLTVAVNPAGTFAYHAGNGFLAVHSIDPATGVLTPIAGSPFSSAAPQTNGARVALNGEILYTLASTQQAIHIYALDPTTGVPTELDDSPVATGTGFESFLDPLNRFFYMTDQGGNSLYGFSIVP